MIFLLDSSIMPQNSKCEQIIFNKIESETDNMLTKIVVASEQNISVTHAFGSRTWKKR